HPGRRSALKTVPSIWSSVFQREEKTRAIKPLHSISICGRILLLCDEVQTMKKILFAAICILLLGVVPVIYNAQVDTKWKVHDPDRPAPPAIDPGTASTQDSSGRPPSDA